MFFQIFLVLRSTGAKQATFKAIANKKERMIIVISVCISCASGALLRILLGHTVTVIVPPPAYFSAATPRDTPHRVHTWDLPAPWFITI